MTKKVISDDMASELASGSVFFRPVQDRTSEQQEAEASPTEVTQLPRRSVASSLDSTPASTSDSNRAITTDSTPDSDGASTLASTVDSTIASKTDSSNASTR